MLRPLRQSVGVLLHRPWYTASTVSVIAVSFALLASVLAVVDGVLFKPLGYPNEGQLVSIRVSSSKSRSTPRMRPGHSAEWAKATPGVQFTGFSVWGTGENRIGRALVQSNFFDVIGVRPAMGGFAPEDFASRQPLIEPRIISDEIFRSRFGGDLGAVGRTVIDNPVTGTGYRIVGVMPPGFAFPHDRLRVGYIGPFVSTASIHVVMARMKPGVTTDDVRQRVLATVTAEASARVGPTNPDDGPVIDQVDVQPISRLLGAASRPLFTAFLAAAGILLVVTALNASSLMAARSLDRGRELAVRRALGATPRNLARLLLVEVTLLVGAGAVIGLALVGPIVQVIDPLLPDNVVLFRAAALDWRVAAITGALAAAIAGVATLVLLGQATANDVRLRPDRSVTEPARSLKRRLVVIVQVALALVLTVAGALLVGSLLSVYGQREPIRTAGVITIPSQFLDRGPVVDPAQWPAWVKADLAQRAARVKVMLERLRHVPGVDAAAVTGADFLNGGRTPPKFAAPPGKTNERVLVEAQAVGGDYYRVIEPQLIAGRLPTATELANDEPVIVVGERVASHYWPHTSAIGQTLTDNAQHGLGLTFVVVGVVKDVRWFSWDGNTVPTIYSPFALRAGFPEPTFLIRASADTARVTADVLRAMADTDPLLRTGQPVLLDDLFADSVRPRRLQAWLFGSFAAASLFVVGIGILGQLAMSTARRTREVGIRMTLGSPPGGILRLIVREQLVAVVAGLIAGAIGAAWAVQFLGSYLYQVGSYDGRVWAAAIALILLSAVIGTLIPAFRASRVDPTQALRTD
jgi:predicted permease